MELINFNSQILCNTAVALGFFDGLHKGHLEVIRKAVDTKNVASAVFTFNNSPLLDLKKQAPAKIITNEQKFELLNKFGVEFLLSVDFNNVMNLSAEEFVEKILVNKLNAKYVYCGFNFSFGKNGMANANDLQYICSKYGIQVESISPVLYDGKVISSTAIRALLKSGNIITANKMLGRPFSFNFVVIHGKKLGRILGAPTINQSFPDNFINPKFGVYSSLVKFDDVSTYGVTNIGIKPTVGSELPLAETFMPEYRGNDIYGKKVEVSLIEFIRPEIKFDSLDCLSKQIKKDVYYSKEIFNKLVCEDCQ